jgi:hypothetical protein
MRWKPTFLTQPPPPIWMLALTMAVGLGALGTAIASSKRPSAPTHDPLAAVWHVVSIGVMWLIPILLIALSSYDTVRTIRARRSR